MSGSSTPATDFWITKNSWGTGFGESEYLRIKRGVNMRGINQWLYPPLMTTVDMLPSVLVVKGQNGTDSTIYNTFFGKFLLIYK